jgi:hypothetical protein
MNGIAFDIHAAAIRFKQAGFTEDQVEALVAVTRETTALPDVSTLATKTDVERLELATDGRFKTLETRMDARFQDLETRMDARFTQVDARIDKMESKLEAKIGAAQVQSLTILIAAMALITTLGSVLPKLLQ